MHLAAAAAATARKTAAAAARKEARAAYADDPVTFCTEVLAEEPTTALRVYEYLRQAQRCLAAAERHMCNLEVAMNPDREPDGTVEGLAVLDLMNGGVLAPAEEIANSELFQLLDVAFRDLEN